MPFHLLKGGVQKEKIMSIVQTELLTAEQTINALTVFIGGIKEQRFVLQTLLHSACFEIYSRPETGSDYSAVVFNKIYEQVKGVRALDTEALARWIGAFAPVDFVPIEKGLKGANAVDAPRHYEGGKQKMALVCLPEEPVAAKAAYWNWVAASGAATMWYDMRPEKPALAQSVFDAAILEKRIKKLVADCAKAGFNEASILIAGIQHGAVLDAQTCMDNKLGLVDPGKEVSPEVELSDEEEDAEQASDEVYAEIHGYTLPESRRATRARLAVKAKAKAEAEALVH